MKHLYIISLMLVVSALTNPAYAQFTGGGEEEREPDEPQEINEIQANQTSLFKYGVLKIGFANPSGIYATKPQRGDKLRQIFNSQAGFGAERGFSVGVYGASSLGIGSQNLFESLGIGSQKLIKNNIAAEIGYTYGLNYSQNVIDWGDYVNSYEDTSYWPFHYIDVKLGPVLAISPYPNLVFDLFYNAMLTLSIPAEMEFQDNLTQGSDDYVWLYVEEEDYPIGIRHGIGFSIRYARLMFSVEKTWGSIETVYNAQVVNDFGGKTSSYDSVMNNCLTFVSLGILF